MDFTSLIKNARPHLKNNSVKAYATSLKLLAPEEETGLDFLYDHESVMLKLGKYKPTTRKNYLNAAIVVLRGDTSKAGATSLAKFENLRDKYNTEYSDNARAHKKTPKQEENWIEWDDYLAIVDKLRDSVSHLKSGPSEWSESDLMKYQDYILTLLYSKYPLRNDLSETRVISKTSYNNLTDADKSGGNYLVRHSTNKYFLCLNEYKTSKKYGEKKIEIDAALLKPLRKWLRKQTSGFLLINTQGQAMSSNGITKALNRIGRQQRGKPFGTSLLRHSYLSNKYADVQAEKEKDSHIMGHSIQTQEDYIKKD